MSTQSFIPSALPPGIIIRHLPPADKVYIGSPSLAILPDGSYIASHDIFGPKAGRSPRTFLYKSTDCGESWKLWSELESCTWATLFWHVEALYLFGTDNGYGRVVLRKSEDGGKTWSRATDATNGILLNDGVYHTAPVPILIHNGRIWRSMEDIKAGGSWPYLFRPFVMSAALDANLLDASSWVCSESINPNQVWINDTFMGWLEGNVVADTDGNVFDMVRVVHPQEGQFVARIAVSTDGRRLQFDPGKDFILFPGGAHKFTIRYDQETKYYWTLSNGTHQINVPQKADGKRNALTLLRSSDLNHWEWRCTLLYHPDVYYHAFQYIDWHFDEADLIAVSRTSYRDEAGLAENFHDSNYLTFHRFAGFRNLTPEQSVF